MEFKALSNEEVEQTMAQLSLDPMRATFEKPGYKERKHLRPLFMKIHQWQANDQDACQRRSCGEHYAVHYVPKVWAWGGSFNPNRYDAQGFRGCSFSSPGAICIDLAIGSKTLPTTFFVINGKGSYSTLPGRDWIHASCCIPSTMHHCVVQWIGDSMEVVNADSSFSVATANLEVWSG